MAFTQIISLILKYKNVSLFLVGLGILAQQQPPQITNKTYIEGIRFINRQYDSIK